MTSTTRGIITQGKDHQRRAAIARALEKELFAEEEPQKPGWTVLSTRQHKANLNHYLYKYIDSGLIPDPQKTVGLSGTLLKAANAKVVEKRERTQVIADLHLWESIREHQVGILDQKGNIQKCTGFCFGSDGKLVLVTAQPEEEGEIV